MQLPATAGVYDVGGLRQQLAQLPDPRDRRGVRYSLVDMLTLLILAKLSGEDEVSGMAAWVRWRAAALVELLHLPRRSVPHQTTYERLLERLDVNALESVVGSFFAHGAGQAGVLSLDGKTLRGTIPPGETHGTHLLAVYDAEQDATLMQVEVADHANEWSMTPAVLAQLDLRGRVVTGDAMFTQRPLCEQVVSAGGDYLLVAKANQATLQQAIADTFMPPPLAPAHAYLPPPEGTTYSLDARHGRLEYRFLTTSTQLTSYLDWPHLAQVFRLQRLVQQSASGRLSYEVVFGITSLPPDRCSPDRLLTLIRTHWHIENRLHYVRDVTFHEDACSLRWPNCQRVLATLNNLVLGLLRRTPFRFIPQARRFFDAHLAQAVQLLL